MIVPIPMNDNPMTLAYFSLISMYNVIFKVLFEGVDLSYSSLVEHSYWSF